MSRDHGVEVLVAHVPEDAIPKDASVGAHDVEVPERLDGAGDELVGGVGGSDGADLGDDTAAGSGDLVRRGLGDIAVDASATAYARPMPRSLPVTTATFPSRFMAPTLVTLREASLSEVDFHVLAPRLIAGLLVDRVRRRVGEVGEERATLGPFGQSASNRLCICT